MNLKKIGYKILTYLPGVGLAAYSVKEYKSRKGKNPAYNLKESKDRRALGVYALETGYLALAIAWKIYVGNGIATGDWNPFDSNLKQEKEHMNKVMKENKKINKENYLEKTVNYKELIK
jgi:hypothetical protein